MGGIDRGQASTKRASLLAGAVGALFGAGEAFLLVERGLGDALLLIALSSVLYAVSLAAILLGLGRILRRRDLASLALAVAIGLLATLVATTDAIGARSGRLVLSLASVALGIGVGWLTWRVAVHYPAVAAVRLWCAFAVVAVLCAAALSWSPQHTGFSGAGPSKPKPNVLLVSLDTTRADHIGSYGYAPARTPVLDALVSEGARFERAISTAARTGPAHTSLLTGLYPPNHGALYNGRPMRGDRTSLPLQLHEHGYHTAAFVSGVPLRNNASGLARHFDVYDDDFLSNSWLPAGFVELRLVQPFRPILERFGLHFRRSQRLATETNEAALGWLAEANEPFFGFVHYYDPHATYAPPLRFARLYDAEPLEFDWYELSSRAQREFIETPGAIDRSIALYDAEISYVDEEVGRLLEVLRSRGIIDRTIVVVTSDHGESLGERHVYFDHVDLYDHVVRVPLIIWAPGRVRAGSTVAGEVSMTDLAPTIADLLGLDTTPFSDGTSLLRALSGGRVPSRPAFSFLYERSRRLAAVSVRAAGSELILHEARRRKTTFIPERYEYDRVAGDPREVVDPAAEHDEKLDAMITLLDRWRSERPSGPAKLDPEVKRALEALGYVGD